MLSNTRVKKIIKANDEESSRVPWRGGRILQECICDKEVSVCPVIKLLESKGYKREPTWSREFMLPDVEYQYINFDIPPKNISSFLYNAIYNVVKRCEHQQQCKQK